MQTFLPYADFTESASILDRARLGKQRIENVQLLRGMIVPGAGYASHPCTLMWTDWKALLYKYHQAIIHEWVNVRGYKDKQAAAFDALILPYFEMHPDEAQEPDTPTWLGAPSFHQMHQSKLLHKAHNMTESQMRRLGIGRDYYDQFFPGVPDDIDFVWIR